MKNHATMRPLLVLVLMGVQALSPFSPSSLFAAPGKSAAEPTAEGFPAWTGITPKNRIYGRQLLSNADLRQRITVVVEFDAAKASEQLEQTGLLAANIGINNLRSLDCSAWATYTLPHDVMVIYSAHNAKDHAAIVEVMKVKDVEKEKGKMAINSAAAPIYENVTFAGAPDNGGKFPFVYVMGYEGTEPLYKGPFTADSRKEVRKVIVAQKKEHGEKVGEWKPFYGYVAEPAHYKDIGKTMAKGKPLEPIEAKLKSGISSKTPEVAREAQMLYDALQQTKSDKVYIIRNCYATAPHVASVNLAQVLKYWPKTKKLLSDVADKIKSNTSAQPVIKMYTKIVVWADPEFTCKNAGEAKKIVAELNKMKKQILPLTSDKDVTVQNCAWVIDGMLDELISTIPNKVPQK